MARVAKSKFYLSAFSCRHTGCEKCMGCQSWFSSIKSNMDDRIGVLDCCEMHLDGRYDRMVGRDEHEAALGHLMDTLGIEVGSSVAGKLPSKFVGEGGVVGLQLLDAVGLGLGEKHRGKRLSGGGEGGVVDARDLGAEGCEWRRSVENTRG